MDWIRQFLGSKPALGKLAKGARKRLLIIGTGWGGFRFLRNINKDLFDVTVVSSRNYFLVTPLLVSACAGTVGFRAVVEPVRQKSLMRSSGFRFFEARTDSIDLDSKTVQCVRDISGGTERFSLEFDKLLIACGAVTNTFNVPGVAEHAHFLKDLDHGQKIRARVIECFEEASMPYVPTEKARQLLHFVCIGGGPTGVELFLEMTNLISNLKHGYPKLVDRVQMTIVDVAPTILGTVDPALAKQVMAKLSKYGICVRTQRSVKQVDEDSLVLDNGEILQYGLLVWATGVTQGPLVRGMDSVAKDARSGRILVDDHLRVLGPNQTATGDIYAIGDCATPKDHLPCTAQVASQEGEYLASLLNRAERTGREVSTFAPFTYFDRGSATYTGGCSAVIELVVNKKKWKLSGTLAGLFWGILYWSKLGLWRNRVMVPAYWLSTWLSGRDGCHLK